MKRFTIMLAVLGLMAVSCGEKPEPEPAAQPAPKLLSTTPENGASGFTSSSMTVVFTYDQNIKCSQEAQKGVTIDAGASITAIEAYSTDLKVSVSGLVRGQSYTVSIADGTVQGFRMNQPGAQAATLRFSMKEEEQLPPEPEDPAQWEKASEAVRHMGVGWNLGNTLESNSGDVNHMWIEGTPRATSNYETAWGQPVATRELIHMFKEAGFNTIRVPVTWYPHMGTVTVSRLLLQDGEYHYVWDKSTWTGYDVDPVWMARVKEVVGYVLDEGMYCVLNVHHDTGTATTAWLRADREVYDSVKERFISLWTQIATEFASYGQRLLFESFNEMLDSGNNWNSSTHEAHEMINLYNADFVATVRATGGRNAYRNLILNTYAASCQKEALADFRLPEDSVEGHLMAEVHSYAPYHFAFDTATPKTVFDDACETEVRGLVEGMNTYLVSRGIPCVLGEFGADTAKREEKELAKQASCYVSAAAKYNIPCLYWMALSDGADRAVPKWTKPVLKDAILKAYRDN